MAKVVMRESWKAHPYRGEGWEIVPWGYQDVARHLPPPGGVRAFMGFRPKFQKPHLSPPGRGYPYVDSCISTIHHSVPP